MADPWVGEFSFLGNTPNVNEELRRRIALQMLSSGKGRGFPKTLGEGLSAIGDAIGDRGIMSRLAAEEAASEKAGSDAVGRLSGPIAYAPTGDVTETPTAPAASAAPPVPLTTAPEQPASMLRPNLPTTLGGAVPNANVPESTYTSPNRLGMPPAPAPAGDRWAQQSAALAGIESGGAKDPYRVVGAATKTGDRAYGKYQIMGANIPEWTRAALGQPLTVEQFLANPEAQEATAKNRFTGYANKYGDEGAARAWFAGEGGMKNLNATDVHGRLNVGTYGQDFMRRMGGPQAAASPRDAVSAQIVAQGQDPVEQPGQQATLGSPILPQGLSAAPPQQPIRAMPAPQQPVRVAQAGGQPQGLTAGYVMPEQPTRTPPPTTTPTLQRIQQEIARAAPANRAAVQRALQPYIEQEKAKITDAHTIHKDQLTHDRAMELKRQEQLASSLKRQQDYDKAEQDFIRGNGRPPSPDNVAKLGTPQSMQRTGIPSPMPIPPGVTPQKWAELQAPLLVKANEAYEKAVPSFNETIATLKLAREHPGREWGVGTFSDIAKRTPGTAAYGFGKLMEQIGGKNFLVAYQALKGGGPITEIEGTKAEAAQARLATAQTKEDFDAALNDFEKAVRGDLELAQRKVNRPVTAWGKGNDDYAPDIGERRGNMEYIGGNPADRMSWEAGQMSAERPWEDYVDPVAPVAAPAGGGVDWTDVGKSAVGGLGRGATGLAGLPGDISEYGARGIDWATQKVGRALGVDVAPRQAQEPSYGSAAAKRAIEGVTGEFYEPKTVAGQYASTIGEFAPSALIPGGGGITARVLNTVVPAVASETAGQATKGTEAEPWARGIAGIGAGVVGGRLVTPAPPATPARQAAVNVLEREGVPLTAGERTGSKAVRWAEATAGDMPLSSGRAQQMQQDQAAALDRAFTRRTFDPAELQQRGLPPDAALPRADVMAHGRQSLSDRYNQMSAAHQLRADPPLVRDLHQATTNYERLALPSQRATGTRDVAAIRDDIVNQLIAGQGRMPGDAYQAARSRMGTLSESVKNSDPTLANALRDIRGALDRGMQRSLPPDVAARWTDTNRRWGNMKQLEGAVASAGENLSPARVAQSVRSGRQSQAARGAGDMDELARSANLVIKPMPSSGTAQRQGWQQLFGMPGMLSAAGGGVGSAFGPLGAVAGTAVPHLASRAVLSRLGQRYLGNQAAPQETRDLLAQALVQQGASQPGGIERNKKEQEAYRRKREQALRNAGLK